MTRFIALVMLTITAWMVGWLAAASSASAAEFAVDPKGAAAGDGNPGTADKPLKTLARALELAKGGDTILLGTAEYPAVVIDKTYDKPLAISAAKGAKPVFIGGLAIRRGGGLRLSGVTFTWTAATRPAGRPMTPFIEITDAKNVELSELEIYDDPKLNTWVGWACNMTNSDQITIRDSKAHHFYFGFSAARSTNVIFRNLDIAMWSHEDGARVTECEGPVLIEGCHITNSGKAGAKGGHVDGIQSVFWNHNITIRNCFIHGLGQGIGAFGAGKDHRLKNWRVEGCLVYDTYAPHVCSIYGCDGVTVVNNTFPQNRPLFTGSTDIVVRNNIIGLPCGAQELGKADYNLFMAGNKIGEHDLVGDPKFVNCPLFVMKSDSAKIKETTRSKFFFREGLKGKLAVGDIVEVYNTDGSARDAKARKITAMGDNWIEVDTPLERDVDPEFKTVFVYKWPAGQKDLNPDYHLKADSPAIDSADSAVKRGRDMGGHEATDAPGAANTGAGTVKYLDRGALEFAPTK